MTDYCISSELSNLMNLIRLGPHKRVLFSCYEWTQIFPILSFIGIRLNKLSEWEIPEKASFETSTILSYFLSYFYQIRVLSINVFQPLLAVRVSTFRVRTFSLTRWFLQRYAKSVLLWINDIICPQLCRCSLFLDNDNEAKLVMDFTTLIMIL